jgi:hypothetical protein
MVWDGKGREGKGREGKGREKAYVVKERRKKRRLRIGRSEVML